MSVTKLLQLVVKLDSVLTEDDNSTVIARGETQLWAGSAAKWKKGEAYNMGQVSVFYNRGDLVLVTLAGQTDIRTRWAQNQSLVGQVEYRIKKGTE